MIDGIAANGVVVVQFLFHMGIHDIDGEIDGMIAE